MRRICIAALAFFLTSGMAIAASDAASAPTSSEIPAAQVHKLTQEWNQKQQEFYQRYQQAKTEQERQKIANSYPDPQPYARKLLAIAQANPHTAAARDALIFIVHTATDNSDTTNAALDQLAAQFANDSQISRIVPRLAWMPNAEPLLRAIAEKNGDRRTQGMALYVLGENLKNRAEQSARNPQESKELYQQSETVFQQVIDKYGEVTGGRGSLADAARNQLFEMHNLRVGKPAPEITGTTVDGKTMKLSNYKGKVVVLDFWGDW